jgi:hypothetical protein
MLEGITPDVGPHGVWRHDLTSEVQPNRQVDLPIRRTCLIRRLRINARSTRGRERVRGTDGVVPESRANPPRRRGSDARTSSDQRLRSGRPTRVARRSRPCARRRGPARHCQVLIRAACGGSGRPGDVAVREPHESRLALNDPLAGMPAPGTAPAISRLGGDPHRATV